MSIFSRLATLFVILALNAPLNANAMKYKNYEVVVNSDIQTSYRLILTGLQKCKDLFTGSISGQYFSDINEAEISQYGAGDASGLVLEKFKLSSISENETKIIFSEYTCVFCTSSTTVFPKNEITNSKLKLSVDWIERGESSCPVNPEPAKPNL